MHAGTMAGLETVRLIRSAAAEPCQALQLTLIHCTPESSSSPVPCRVCPLQGCHAALLEANLHANWGQQQSLGCPQHKRYAPLQGAGSCRAGLRPEPQA